MNNKNQDDKKGLISVVAGGSLIGYIAGVVVGSVGQFGIPTYTRLTLERIVQDADEITKQEGSLVRRSGNLALEMTYYYASITTVFAAGAALWSNVVESGRGEFNYWQIPLLATNVLSMFHEVLRNNNRYDIFFQKRIEEPVISFLDKLSSKQVNHISEYKEEQ